MICEGVSIFQLTDSQATPKVRARTKQTQSFDPKSREQMLAIGTLDRPTYKATVMTVMVAIAALDPDHPEPFEARAPSALGPHENQRASSAAFLKLHICPRMFSRFPPM